MGNCVPGTPGAGFGPGRGVDVGVWMDGWGIRCQSAPNFYKIINDPKNTSKKHAIVCKLNLQSFIVGLPGLVSKFRSASTPPAKSCDRIEAAPESDLYPLHLLPDYAPCLREKFRLRCILFRLPADA